MEVRRAVNLHSLRAEMKRWKVVIGDDYTEIKQAKDF